MNLTDAERAELARDLASVLKLPDGLILYVQPAEAPSATIARPWVIDVRTAHEQRITLWNGDALFGLFLWSDRITFTRWTRNNPRPGQVGYDDEGVLAIIQARLDLGVQRWREEGR